MKQPPLEAHKRNKVNFIHSSKRERKIYQQSNKYRALQGNY